VAGEILASLADVNTWLDAKVSMSDADDDDLQIDAQRIIKSTLAGTFTPTILYGWDSPSNTPELIRGVAGRLIAAYWYKEKYSEDDTDIPPYAQSLYDEAIQMLKDIRSGVLTVLDDNDEAIAVSGLEPIDTWFWPNDTTPGPVFTMEMEFG
jgi:hypothetical protein